jgi:hypothetical protein
MIYAIISNVILFNKKDEEGTKKDSKFSVVNLKSWKLKFRHHPRFIVDEFAIVECI